MWGWGELCTAQSLSRAGASTRCYLLTFSTAARRSSPIAAHAAAVGAGNPLVLTHWGPELAIDAWCA